MAKILARIWAALVGAVAGACIGFLAMLLLLLTGSSLEIGLWAVAILALLGGTVGLVFGNITFGSK
jgi:hypothetical protein